MHNSSLEKEVAPSEPFKQVRYSLASYRILKFQYDEPPEPVLSANFRTVVNRFFSQNKDGAISGLVYDITVSIINSLAEEPPFAEMTTRFLFELETPIVPNQMPSDVPSALSGSLIGIAVSTIRGLFDAKLSSTVYRKLSYPLVNIHELVPKELFQRMGDDVVLTV